MSFAYFAARDFWTHSATKAKIVCFALWCITKSISFCHSVLFIVQHKQNVHKWRSTPCWQVKRKLMLRVEDGHFLQTPIVSDFYCALCGRHFTRSQFSRTNVLGHSAEKAEIAAKGQCTDLFFSENIQIKHRLKKLKSGIFQNERLSSSRQKNSQHPWILRVTGQYKLPFAQFFVSETSYIVHKMSLCFEIRFHYPEGKNRQSLLCSAKLKLRLKGIFLKQRTEKKSVPDSSLTFKVTNHSMLLNTRTEKCATVCSSTMPVTFWDT